MLGPHDLRKGTAAEVAANTAPAEAVGAVVAHQQLATVRAPTTVLVKSVTVFLELAVAIKFAALLHPINMTTN